MCALKVRPGRPEDIAPLDALLARSYPKLLSKDYPPSVLVTAIPRISHAQPALVTCGTYFVALRGPDLVGGGGWTPAVPGRFDGERPGVGHIRHFATDVALVRSGIGRALMTRVFESAGSAGIKVLECLSTRTAVPFYENMGFVTAGETLITLDAGITFPAVRMSRRLDR